MRRLFRNWDNMYAAREEDSATLLVCVYGQAHVRMAPRKGTQLLARVYAHTPTTRTHQVALS
jgi:hypothetical protein